MKITIYELLGMVKNDNVDYKYVKYFDRLNEKDDVMLACAENIIYKLDNSNIELNDTAEIIEKSKGIPEKIEIYKDEEGHYFIDKHCKKIYITCDEVNFMVEEFNQLLDYLKSKGD